MESQLQSLINKIKTDGVAEAEKEAQAVVTEAENKASRIEAEAKTKADEIVERAKQEAARTEEAGKKALEQAGRNLVLGLEKNITGLFDTVMKEEIKTALTPDVLATLLEKILGQWEPGKGVVVQLSKEDAAALTNGLLGKLQEKAKGGLTLQPVDTVDSGFSIGEKDGSAYYDFTDWGIAEVLAEYLNPMLGDILKKGVK